MNGIDLFQYFWLVIVLLFIIVPILMLGFNALVSKWFGVERKGLFYNSYLNDRHKKIDRAIRLIALISLIAGYTINVNTVTNYWFLEPWFVMILFFLSTYIFTIVMERKYASNSNTYKVTLSEMGFVIVLLLMILTSLWRVV